jgi:hypothetical protein
MYKSIFLCGLLLFIASSLLSYSQDAKQSETVTEPEMPDEITFKSSVGDVLFPHNVHVEDEEMECSECHHQIHAKELETPHPDYLTSSWINCQNCHNPNLETKKMSYNCSDCHHSDPDNIADETLSSKVVIHKSCWECHEAGTGVEASEVCGDCHVKDEE